ncbi:uncharacterized protein TRIVIDRAFT_226640 [Trichoderma virens Gv29-8]|uniref:Lysine-specific metallo-endopeptidase domain-containing protein n=1 Tax=Hypocrea virens (strain Gv29-8 / FGSC 10586) TaxID=413071 RepID=G9N6D4_HYPVG|nr:uncharacterized protein TRIVIDRAFT_226640 [Trichoderma virens Gv29-8]EHK17696.1 hypothetical protein TRIVIDRAFT_226640 [Trichoderma virens Gv29-8]UKZ53592.1 hypothetical protein TrVGV298_007387 [Trichoderma virens]
MRYSLATLPSIFWLLASTCEAKPWGTYKSQDVGLDTVNETLWRRVRVPGGTGNNAPPPADQIFLFGPDNLAGGCSGQKSDIEAWLAEVRLIHNAVETLYSMITKPSVSKIWENFFGIFMRHNPDTNAFEIDPVSIQRWQQIGDHIARVSEFLDGNGLREPVVPGEVPRIFCSGDAGKSVEWDSIVKDEHGTEVVKSTEPVTGEKKYTTLGEAYPSQVGGNAFWMSSFNGYWFTASKEGQEVNLCPANGRSGATGRPDVPILQGLNVKLAKANRGIIICPKAWTRQVGQPHGQPSLSQAVSGDNYPKGDGSKGELLDRLVPMSMTLYHELIHLTDFNKQTAKPDIYDLNTILRMTISIKQADKDAIPHNPETYVFLGMAAYIYLNPPEGKPAILYISGKSATEDAMWASVKRKREEGA